jgi:hypothetical protein
MVNKMNKMKEYNEWYWKLYRWFKWDAKHAHRDIAQGFRNLWKWFPLVWKDRDWDHHFIFETLKFKITNTANYIKSHDRYVGADRDYEVMMTCVRLIEKIQEEDYDGEWGNYINQKMTMKEIEGESSKILDFVLTKYLQVFKLLI